MAASLTRRDAFAAAAAAGLALPAAARAQGGTVATWTPTALSPAQAATLSAACETIVPTTDTPGAAAAGVPQAIDRWMVDWMSPAEAARLRAGLDDLDARAKAMGAAAFAAASPAQRASVAGAVEGEALAAAKARQPHYWLALRDLTTAGYFTSRVGATQALRYDPVPGAYHGCVPLKTIGRGWATS